MRNLLAFLPILITLGVYRYKRREFLKENILEIRDYEAQETHKEALGLNTDLPFYERGLFKLINLIPSGLFIGIGRVLIILYAFGLFYAWK